MEVLITRELVEAGPCGDVYMLWRQGRCQLREFLDSIPLSEQRKLWRAFGTLAAVGPPRNAEKFRKLHAEVESWEIKSGAMRVVLFYDGPSASF